MRIKPIARRLAATTAAAALVLLTATVPATTVEAQPHTPAGPKPPPLDPSVGAPIPSNGPDHDDYVPKKQCVRSLDDGTTNVPNEPWGQKQLQIREAHKFARGRDVPVAVIDTGVKDTHEYLGGRVRGVGDYVVKGEQGIKDCDGHGTEVAGIIAADITDERIGFRGVAPDARILSIRQSSSNYSRKPKVPEPGNENMEEVTAGNLTTLAQAIMQAAQAGAKVINMSVNDCRPAAIGQITQQEQKLQAAIKQAVDVYDAVLVTSAGNTGGGKACPQSPKDAANGPDPQKPVTIVNPPWFSDDVLSVAAVQENGEVAEFSIQGPWISVAAPGTKIISLNPTGKGLANKQQGKNEGQLDDINGTSFAAPYVAGLAALVRERFKNLNARQVMERIKYTAMHPAAAGGRDNRVGHGMINPVAALTVMIPSESGIAPAKASYEPLDMPAPAAKDWTPMQVALIGAGGGVGVLLLTMFVVHTVRRNRRDPHIAPRGHA
ncbi:membrane-anchored mycosin MYCP [Herbihabitans rhizosphaerae]|uniref:Membrane-anchored mycosin MYCP n=1 Tax=Herbihabitans rhizosphaerae TaxID=1872711 RepID=A0A4Q7KKW3_9PSEU|nr:type VII secretion-associated serine protease mycosin [Herbihabitans rhizosphaerae]RZS37135.1 membrane-anchored mycosin MYCP [Herbihabitans rhizosphaerae]